jgi:hypothetical protein
LGKPSRKYALGKVNLIGQILLNTTLEFQVALNNARMRQTGLKCIFKTIKI